MRLIIFFFLFSFALSAQNSIVKTVGYSYTNGAPTYTPAKAGSALALDTVTWRYYTWNGTSWLSDGFRVQTISGCSAPGYTPTKFQSHLVINACTAGQGGPELYYWNGSAWLQINEGQTYTAGTGIDITGGVISATSTGGPDSTFVGTDGDYTGKRITGSVYRNGTTGFCTTDTTGVLNIKIDANALPVNQKIANYIFHEQSSTTDNPERSHVWSIYDPNGLAGNIPANKKFGRWYDYTTYSPDLNTPADPADTTGDMVHIMGYNLGRSDNNLRGSTWFQFEQDFNQPGSPHALKDLMEFHLNHLFLDGTGFRSINANATTDGKYIETSLGGDDFRIAPARGLITPVLIWDNRTRYFTFFDTTQLYFANNLPGAIIEKYQTGTSSPFNILYHNADNSLTVGDVKGVRVSDTLQIKYAGSQDGGTFTALGVNTIQLNSAFKIKTSNDRLLSFEKTGIASPNDWQIRVDAGDTWSFGKSISSPQISVYKNAETELITLRSGSVSIGRSYSIPARFSVFQNANDVGGGLALVNLGATRTGKIFTSTTGLHLVGGGSTNDIIVADGKTTFGNSSGVSVSVFQGLTASPEGSVSANQGDIAITRVSSVGDLLVKDSGTGNTGWLPVAKVRKATSTLDFSLTAAGQSSELTVTVSGAVVGDPVTIAPPASPDANSCFTAWVSATNTVTVRFNNYSASPIDPASATYNVVVTKY